jgi:hypothetical protein
MSKKIEKGMTVRVAREDNETYWTFGHIGKVLVSKRLRDCDDGLNILVEFPDAEGRGHGDPGDDARPDYRIQNRWWLNENVLDVVSPDELVLGSAPFETKHFRAGSQTSTILAHLLKGKSITNNESMLVYGIYRLSDCVHKIREAGFDVITALKQDEVGRKYSSYSLAAKAS